MQGHNDINNIFSHAFSSAGISNILQSPEISRDENIFCLSEIYVPSHSLPTLMSASTPKKLVKERPLEFVFELLIKSPASIFKEII